MPTTDTSIAAPPATTVTDRVVADRVVTDRCAFFDAPHAHFWEYTNGHLVCAFCDEKRPYPA